VPARDRQNLKITWGIRAAAQPSYFQRDYISDNRLETVATMKRAIRNHKGKIDFPTVYVNAMASFWVTTQRFSLNKNKYFDIGLFEQPNWKELATMNTTKCDKYLQTMMKALIAAYRQNWFFILQQYSRRWTNQEQAEAFETVPMVYSDIRKNFSGSIWLTTDNSAEARRIANTGLSQRDRAPIDTTGKFYLTRLRISTALLFK
jgi:hypothetical protein